MPEGTEETTTPVTAPVVTPPATTSTDSGKAPKWEGEFDPERAARLVENLRTDLAKRDSDLTELRAKIEAGSGTEKTLQERLDALEGRAVKAERDLVVARVAKAHSIPEDLTSFLTGDSEAAIAKAAEALAAHLKKPADDVPGRPRPKLTPGTGADPEDDFDATAIAKAVRRR